MIRYLISCVFIALIIAASGALFFPSYWVHRFDDIIAKQAKIYRLDEKLVWSLVYEETWFRPWKHGSAGEVGLMQVTPTVAKEWAKETGLKVFEKQVSEDFDTLLADPERNIQIGCWYLEKVREPYRGSKAETAMMLAAYNAGPSRVTEWSGQDAATVSESDFISRIDISTTKSYVSSILGRYRNLPNTTE